MSEHKLKDLERQNKYLFHGSGNIIKEFEPRQAYTIVNGKRVADGAPAVFGSPISDYALFMAIVNEVNCPKGFRSGCSYKSGQIEFTATKETLDQLNRDSRGFVYVFDRLNFDRRNAGEWLSYKKVKPLNMIEVRWSDFLPSIKVIENDILK